MVGLENTELLMLVPMQVSRLGTISTHHYQCQTFSGYPENTDSLICILWHSPTFSGYSENTDSLILHTMALTNFLRIFREYEYSGSLIYILWYSPKETCPSLSKSNSLKASLGIASGVERRDANDRNSS